MERGVGDGPEGDEAVHGLEAPHEAQAQVAVVGQAGELQRSVPGHGRGPQGDPLLAGVGVLLLGCRGALGGALPGGAHLVLAGEVRALEPRGEAVLALLAQAAAAGRPRVLGIDLDLDGLVPPRLPLALAALLALRQQGLLAGDRVGHDVRAAVALVGGELLAPEDGDREQLALVAVGEVHPARLDLDLGHARDDDVRLERVARAQVQQVRRLPQLGAGAPDHDAQVHLGGQRRLEASRCLDEAAEQTLRLAEVPGVALAAAEEPDEASGQRSPEAVAHAAGHGHVLEEPHLEARARAGRDLEDLHMGDEVGVLDAQGPGPRTDLAEARRARALQGGAGGLLHEAHGGVLQAHAGGVLDHDLELGGGEALGRAARDQRGRDLLRPRRGLLGRDRGLEVQGLGLGGVLALGEGHHDGDRREGGCGQGQEGGAGHGEERTARGGRSWSLSSDRCQPRPKPSPPRPGGAPVSPWVSPRGAPGRGAVRPPRPPRRPRPGRARAGRGRAGPARARRPPWRRSS